MVGATSTSFGPAGDPEVTRFFGAGHGVEKTRVAVTGAVADVMRQLAVGNLIDRLTADLSDELCDVVPALHVALKEVWPPLVLKAGAPPPASASRSGPSPTPRRCLVRSTRKLRGRKGSSA